MKTVRNIDTAKLAGQEVSLFGWVHARRNLGKIVFIDLRDRSGLVQVVMVPAELTADSQAILKDIRPEFVLEITGQVQVRGEKQRRSDQPTGQVEVLARSVKILATAETPPFEIENEDRQANEELRLKYRYLDLRHERLRRNLEFRSQAMQFVRNYLHEQGFIEIHTPILSKSTPEGARDYLVPSRKFKGKFFALPQSPQQYKQLLMVAGLEKYFQIAPCFRDEDARAERSPGEFYQIDMEMSFVSQDDILKLTEDMFTQLVRKLLPDKKITQTPWPRITYQAAKQKYNSDKPDLRTDKNNPAELAFAWVVDFPLFTEQTEEDFFHGAGEKWAPSHHMFTAPKEEDIPLLTQDPGRVRSYQHDLVLNGYEVGGGSIRITDPQLQEQIFDLIGFDQADKDKFAHLLTAFKYGVPPHGGIAPGFDRLISVLLGEKSIREVIAFPLTSDARDPLLDAPGQVSPEQLDELGLSVKKK